MSHKVATKLYLPEKKKKFIIQYDIKKKLLELKTQIIIQITVSWHQITLNNY